MICKYIVIGHYGINRKDPDWHVTSHTFYSKDSLDESIEFKNILEEMEKYPNWVFVCVMPV
jgi:hypothetical protein